MWLADPNKQKATPEQFDRHYEEWNSDCDRATAAEILELTGPMDGESVIDLGGGPLMLNHIKRSVLHYCLVDFSPVVCAMAKRLAHFTEDGIIQADVVAYLRNPTVGFNLALCFGVVEYLPPGYLTELFDRMRVVADVFCFGTATSESYLQYPGRIVAYSIEDVEKAASDAGWLEMKRLPRSSHLLARYER